MCKSYIYIEERMRRNVPQIFAECLVAIGREGEISVGYVGEATGYNQIYGIVATRILREQYELVAGGEVGTRLKCRLTERGRIAVALIKAKQAIAIARRATLRGPLVTGHCAAHDIILP